MNGGFHIAAEARDLEPYRLACVFAASYQLGEMSGSRSSIRHLQTTFEIPEASRHLISIAAMVRGALDTGSGRNIPKSDRPVGTLRGEGADDEETEELSLREACNKILRADEVDLVGPGGEETLGKKVVLQGSKQNEHWTAEIDVYVFIERASACM